MENSQYRLQEIHHALHNKELHKATAWLMDFARDYAEETPHFEEAIVLRKHYNQARRLGSSEIAPQEEDAILSQGQEVFQKISSLDFTFKDQELRQQYPQYPFLQATDMEKIYPKSQFLLGPVNTVLQPGEITGIVGENGNGKTTLLRILASLLNIDKGSMEYCFHNIPTKEYYDIKHRIAYIPQRLEKWHGTLRENLHFAAASHGLQGQENERSVEFVIHRMGLSNFADLGWSELSSGYKLRFELAKMLVWSPSILILDEPLANLDINAQQWMLQDFKHIARSLKRPVSIILSSQQLFEVEHVANKIIFLRNGQCEYSGDTKDFMADRKGNVFEVAGEFTLPDLQKALATKNYRFSQNGTSITINTGREISASMLLTELIQSGVTIKYFRDISTSAKQLFKL